MIKYLSASDTSMKWWLRHCFFFRNKTSQQHVIWRVQQHTFSQKSNCLSVTDAILNTITFHLNIKICIKRKEVHCSVWQLFHYFSVHINAPQTSSHTHTHSVLRVQFQSDAFRTESLTKPKCQFELTLSLQASQLSMPCFLRLIHFVSEGSETHSHKLQRWCSRREWHESSWGWCLCRNQWGLRSCRERGKNDHDSRWSRI